MRDQVIRKPVEARWLCFRGCRSAISTGFGTGLNRWPSRCVLLEPGGGCYFLDARRPCWTPWTPGDPPPPPTGSHTFSSPAIGPAVDRTNWNSQHPKMDSTRAMPLVRYGRRLTKLIKNKKFVNQFKFSVFKKFSFFLLFFSIHVRSIDEILKIVRTTMNYYLVDLYFDLMQCHALVFIINHLWINSTHKLLASYSLAVNQITTRYIPIHREFVLNYGNRSTC